MSGVKKVFLACDVTIAACLKFFSFQQIFSPKEKKAPYCYTFVNLEAASVVCINDFVDKIA